MTFSGDLITNSKQSQMYAPHNPPHCPGPETDQECWYQGYSWGRQPEFPAVHRMRVGALPAIERVAGRLEKLRMYGQIGGFLEGHN